MAEDTRERLPGELPGDSPEEAELDVSGTLFLTTLILVMVFGFWALMYWTLLQR